MVSRFPIPVVRKSIWVPRSFACLSGHLSTCSSSLVAAQMRTLNDGID